MYMKRVKIQYVKKKKLNVTIQGNIVKQYKNV